MKYEKDFVQFRVEDENLNRTFLMINRELLKIANAINAYIEVEATWDPGSIADGDEEAKEVTITDAELGDYAIASFSLDVADLVLNAQVTEAGKVTVILANNTGGAIDLGEGTLYVRVIKK